MRPNFDEFKNLIREKQKSINAKIQIADYASNRAKELYSQNQALRDFKKHNFNITTITLFSSEVPPMAFHSVPRYVTINWENPTSNKSISQRSKNLLNEFLESVQQDAANEVTEIEEIINNIND